MTTTSAPTAIAPEGVHHLPHQLPEDGGGLDVDVEPPGVEPPPTPAVPAESPRTSLRNFGCDDSPCAIVNTRGHVLVRTVSESVTVV